MLSLVTAVLLTGLPVLVGAPTASAGTTREAEFVSRINAVRLAHGLRPLRVRESLTTYARSHSRAMSRQRTLFHTADFSVVCCWSAIAENVGTGFGVRQVHRAFMASAPHRANILDPQMRAVGVGVVSVGDRLWVTEIFRQPR